jgi:Kef-type K+ transport system membrane component KefB
VSLSGLAIVAAVAFGVPLLLGLFPALRVPAIVVELVVGIAIGPSALGWVEVDSLLAALSLIGLAFLLFLAGLEVEFDLLRGRLLEVVGLAFAVSLGIALAVGYAFAAGGAVRSPFLVAVILSATAAGVVVPVLSDAGVASSRVGQLVIAAASLADIATIVLLSLFFSQEETGLGTRLALLGAFSLLVSAVGLVIFAGEHVRRLSATVLRLQDTTAQIRVRGAFLLLAVFAFLAERLGLEVILGAFLAGAALKLLDRDQGLTHPQFRAKLEAAGYGVFVPFFFVTSGLRFDLDALLASGSTLAKAPLFLAALLFVRGTPALLYRPLVGGRGALTAGLLQATSLSFIVVGAQLGIELGLMSEATGAALIAAGLLSVILFPLGALAVLRGEHPGDVAAVESGPSESARDGSA